jgi:type I restriction enzyme, S subunit
VRTICPRPHTTYKHTGLPWVDVVPKHWDLVPNRALMRRRKTVVGDRHTEHRLLSLTKAGVIVRDVDSGKGKFSADMGTCQEVHAGDLVFCLFDIPETPRTVGLSHHDGMITGAYTVFECSDPVLAEFLALFYRALDDRKLLSPLYSGLRNTIPPSRLLGTKTPVPPSDEQSAIVRYIEYVDRRIRRYIRAKLKLIALLEEQKQAAIQDLITLGLDQNARLKSSGVEWIGDVPEHWQTLRCRYLFREIDRRSVDGTEEHLSMSQRLGLVPSHLVEGRTLVAESNVGGRLCEVGDLVLNRLKAHLGVFAQARFPGVISPDYTVFRPLDSEGAEYFELALRSPACRHELRMRAKGIVEGFWRLYTDDFYDIRLPVPSPSERREIVAEANKAASEVDRVIGKAEAEIDLLREYRVRLLADVITGNLDVREAAASLPDETDEAELVEAENLIVDEDRAEDVTEEEAALEEMEI